MNWKLNMSGDRRVTLCNHNYSKEGIFHPNRVMEEYDLLLMQQGSWELWEEDKCFLLEEGMAFLFVPGRHHFSLKKCSPEMRNVFVHFTKAEGDGPEEIAEKTTENTAENTKVSDVPDASDTSDTTAESETSATILLDQLNDCRSNPRVERLMERIINCFWDERLDHREMRMRIYLEELLLELSDLQKKSSGKAGDRMIEQVLSEIRRHPETFFSPEELSRMCSVSVRTLSSRFKASTGQSVHQYQLHLKLAMAGDALSETPDRSLKDIAASFGFYDEFQFSRLFKREFGVSPSAWRKR